MSADWRDLARPATYRPVLNDTAGIPTAIPMRTPSTANLREHWSTRAKRNKAQARMVSAAVFRWLETAKPLVVITLTRVSPRKLDSDNLQSALKAVRDSVARRLRFDDASPLVEWKYLQRKGPAAVEFSVEAVK